MKRTLTIFAIATVGFLGLAGCSAAADSSGDTDTSNSAEGSTNEGTTEEAPASDQTVAEACAIAQSAMTEMGGTMSEIDPTNPEAAAQAFTEAAATARESAAELTNAEVREPFEAIIGVYENFEEIISSGDVDAMNTFVSDVTDATQTMGELCAAG